MNLRVERSPSVNGATIGRLSIDGVFFCYTLEDQIRPVKIKGETAIPAGTYPVKLTPSPRFGRVLPEVLKVPNFIGIRIHAGNRKQDTEGCILVGQHFGVDWISESRMALERLMAKLVEADTITITITNPEPS